MSLSVLTEQALAIFAAILSVLAVIRIIYYLKRAISAPEYPQAWTATQKTAFHFGEAVVAVLTLLNWYISANELWPLVSPLLAGENVSGRIFAVLAFGVVLPAGLWILYERARWKKESSVFTLDFALALVYSAAKLGGFIHY
jgi:hypothetical protein